MTSELAKAVAEWKRERDAILEAWRSGRIRDVANGRLAQLNSNIATACEAAAR